MTIRVWGMILGGYPRSRRARYALRDLERGSIGLQEYWSAMLEVHSEIIGAQKAAGLPVVVDGMIDWHDIFRPFARSWRNVSVNGLLRYFDNNFFYRIPVFKGEPDIIEPVWPPRVRAFRLLADPASLKIVLPGPLTFARLARNESGLSLEDLAERIAVLLRREVELTSEYGVYVQIDEPVLSDRKASPSDAELAVELSNKIIGGVEDRAIFAVYFDFPSRSVLEKILESRARYLALDIADSPSRARENAIPLEGHVPVLGLVDGRRIHEDRLEGPVLEAARRLSEGASEVVVSTTTWMDLIPYRYSLKKTMLVSKLVSRLADELGGEPVYLWR